MIISNKTLVLPESKLVIITKEAKLHRFCNTSCLDAAQLYNQLEKSIGCTYLIYMHENLITNEKYVYSSNWGWQDLLIGERLINHCPIFLSCFNYLEKRKNGHLLVPWIHSPPSNKAERNVCGLRSEFNIANGFGYGAKGNGVRETLAFGGDAKDASFYKHFISDPFLLPNILKQMRLIVLLRNRNQKIISNILEITQ